MPKKYATQRENDAALIKAKMKFMTYDLPPKYWLLTGSRRLNSVLGSEEFGIAYGKIIELFGPNHGGKTLVAEKLVAIAQEDGALACKVDLENSHDDMWSEMQGVDVNSLYLIQPKIGKFHKKDTGPRLQGAEEMFDEAETWMGMKYEEAKKKKKPCKLIVVIDSIAMMKTRLQQQAGATDQNMRTGNDASVFFSTHLPRWVGLALNYNAIVIFINQIRHNPMKRFGDPEYTPGGNAKDHACSVRVRIRRAGKGRITQTGKVVGIIGILKNVKNKAGGGSREGVECGFRHKFGSGWSFMSRAKAEKLIKGEG